ncbi:MAG TPA: DJ-1/PfpI family protein [Candidatus Altiarchaeales archaeon]|nr:DJ-1/PfpI family protein [Candidatus Altiarchaeales archaeon]
MDKSVLMVVAPTDFRDEELFVPKEALEEADIEVVIASRDVDTASGVKGGGIDVDVDLSDADAEDYDAVIFVGGPGSNIYFNDGDAINLAKNAVEAGKILAAICIAPTILANAGLLDGREATVFPSNELVENLEDKGCEYMNEDVVVDGDIITATGPNAAKEFAKAIIKKLG